MYSPANSIVGFDFVISVAKRVVIFIYYEGTTSFSTTTNRQPTYLSEMGIIFFSQDAVA